MGLPSIALEVGHLEISHVYISTAGPSLFLIRLNVGVVYPHLESVNLHSCGHGQDHGIRSFPVGF